MVIPWDLLITGQDQLIRGDVRGLVDNAIPTLSACKFSLYFRPSSKHIVRKGTPHISGQISHDLMPLSSLYFKLKLNLREFEFFFLIRYLR